MKWRTSLREPTSPLILQTRVEFFSLVWTASLMAVMLPSVTQLKQSRYCSRLLLTCLIAVAWCSSFSIISNPLRGAYFTDRGRPPRTGRIYCLLQFKSQRRFPPPRGFRCASPAAARGAQGLLLRNRLTLALHFRFIMGQTCIEVTVSHQFPYRYLSIKKCPYAQTTHTHRIIL